MQCDLDVLRGRQRQQKLTVELTPHWHGKQLQFHIIGNNRSARGLSHLIGHSAQSPALVVEQVARILEHHCFTNIRITRCKSATVTDIYDIPFLADNELSSVPSDYSDKRPDDRASPEFLPDRVVVGKCVELRRLSGPMG